MNVFDIILIILLIIGVYYGYTKGLLMEVINTGSLIVGIILGLKFWQKGAKYISSEYQNVPHLVHVLGFFVVFVVVVLCVRLVGKLIKIGIDKSAIGSLDKILGALLGALKWVSIIGSFLWVIMKYPIFDLNLIINSSVICKFVVQIISKMVVLF